MRHHRHRAASVAPAAASGDISDGVEFRLESGLAQEFGVAGGPLLLHEGRRRDLGQLDQQAFVLVL